jgi:hypothetical protein
MDSMLEARNADIKTQARGIMEDIDAAQLASANVTDLQKLYTSYNTLVDEAERLKNAKSTDRFSILPVELINQIFYHYCRGSTAGPVVLSSVSSRWFKLVCNFAEVWSKITINANELNWQERLEVYTRRSKDRPLDITLCFPLTSEEIRIIIGTGCLPRWRSLTVIDSRSSREKSTWNFLLRLTEYQDLLQLFKFDNFPELRKIDIRVKSPYTREPCLWSSIFLNTPSLQSLSISPILLSNLTVNLVFIEFNALLDLLDANPGLVTIKFSAQRHLVPLVANRQNAVRLHHLQTLISDDMIDILSILRCIDCPNLQTLQLSGATEKMPGLMDYILPLPHLQSLRLKIRGDTEIKLPKVSKFNRSQSNLHHLHIEHYILDTPPPRGMVSAVSQIAPFFPTIKVLRIVTDSPNIVWQQAVHRLVDLEELIIQYDASAKFLYADEEKRFPGTVRERVDLPSLKRLQIRGDDALTILGILRAPNLTFLSIKDAKILNHYTYLSLLSPFPVVRHLEFQALAPNSTLKEIELNLAAKDHPDSPCFIEELVTMHDSCPLLEHMDLTNVRTLRLNGVLQEFGMKRDDLHFTPRSIDISAFLRTPQNKLLLERITTLDLAVSAFLFPSVTGLEETLPFLISLEKIFFPRALFGTKIPVDVLINGMIEQAACPRLVEIHTEDYPQWDPLLRLLGIRNRTLHLDPSNTTLKPIECLYYPAFPHPSMLKPLQMALAGKFPVFLAPSTLL